MAATFVGEFVAWMKCSEIRVGAIDLSPARSNHNAANWDKFKFDLLSKLDST